jgi:YVTN family beta-propeller protein
VVNRPDNTVLVIDAPTNMLVGSIQVGSHPHGIALTPDGKKAYVANFDDKTVSVIDTATNKLVGSIQMGRGPFGISIGPVTR